MKINEFLKYEIIDYNIFDIIAIDSVTKYND